MWSLLSEPQRANQISMCQLPHTFSDTETSSDAECYVAIAVHHIQSSMRLWIQGSFTWSASTPMQRSQCCKEAPTGPVCTESLHIENKLATPYKGNWIVFGKGANKHNINTFKQYLHFLISYILIEDVQICIALTKIILYA